MNRERSIYLYTFLSIIIYCHLSAFQLKAGEPGFLGRLETFIFSDIYCNESEAPLNYGSNSILFKYNSNRKGTEVIPMAVDCGSNLGFENGDFSNWQACTYTPGVWYNPVADPCVDPNDATICPQCPDPGYDFVGSPPVNAGMVQCQNAGTPSTDPRFSIMDNIGTDPNTDNNLSVLAPDGDNYSIRLGNQAVNYQAECVWSTFMVTDATRYFIYQYSIILQDPIHPDNQHGIKDSPRFQATITDLAGNEIGCGGKYTVTSLDARDTSQNFEIAQNPDCNVTSGINQSNIYYRPWTTVATDLGDYMGTPVTVKFCTADCGKGGHYGYAYIDVMCQPVISGFDVCANEDSTLLTAPPGFVNYTWYAGGDTNGTVLGYERTLTVVLPNDIELITLAFNNTIQGGCRTVVTDTLNIFRGEILNNDTAYCLNSQAPGSIQLTSSTSDDNAAFFWYSLPDSVFQSNVQNPLLTGSNLPRQTTQYVLQTTFDIGCFDYDTLTITIQPCSLAVEVNSDTICLGGCANILATITSEGTLPYNILWNDPTFGGLGPFNVCPVTTTTYSITITDSFGVTTSAQGIVTVSNPPQLGSESNDLLCYGSNTGSIELNVSEGTPPFQYQWNNNEQTEDLTALGPGNYSVTVVDSRGCIAILSDTIEGPELLEGQLISSNSGCNNLTDWEVCVQTTGGIPPYTYAWSTGQTGLTCLTGIGVGNYCVTITDDNGCIDTTCTTITGTPTFSVSISSDSVSCSNTNDGQITIAVSGGIPPYTYNWNNGSSSSTITGLSAGAYSVTITDSAGCNSVETATVGGPEAIQIQINSSNNNCDDPTGWQICAQVAEGTQPFSYTWSTGANGTNCLNNMSTGTYCITVTDATGCTDTTCATITGNQPFAVNISPDSISCNGSDDGRLVLTVTGGNPPFSYLWNNGITTNSTIITGLSAGTYIVTVTDSTGCNSVASGTIEEPDVLQIEFSSNQIECSSTSDWQTCVQLSGGTAPYSYQWSTSQANTACLNNISTGTYCITVTDAIGCTDTSCIVIQEEHPFEVSYNIDSISCSGDNNGRISLTVEEGAAPYTYNWNGSNNNSPVLSGLLSGSYSVTVTDSNNCSVALTINLSEPDSLKIILNSNNTCGSNCTGNITATIEGGTPPYNYNWNMASIGNEQNPQNLCAGYYTVTVTDARGCFTTDSITILSDTVPEPASWNIEACAGVEFILPVSGGGIRYNWYPPNHLSNPNDQSPVASPIASVTYTVNITAQNGCIYTDTVYVTVPENPIYSLFIPNAFSPNDDGHNDHFTPVGLSAYIINYEMEIWSRWGEKIYYTDNLEKPWNGRYNNEGLFVQDGIYAYIVKVQDECGVQTGQWASKIGWVVVLKGGDR